MDWYRLMVRLAGPTATAWQADTVFGHLCWALAYTEGEDYLETFLGLYDIGEPQLVLSNGFPGDLLPRPLAPGRPSASAPEDRAAFRASKEARKAEWLTQDAFEAARRGEAYTPPSVRPWKDVVTTHNTIDRTTGTTGEHSLYSLRARALSSEPPIEGRLTIYALVSPDFIQPLRRCLDYLAASGYGKRKSAGLGAIAGVTIEPFAGFAPIDGANGFVSLSNFVPAADDPVRGFWRTMVKRGKLGEHLATAGDPFKRPLIMLEAGACFYDPALRPFYGRLVRDVHPDFPHVVQYGLALAVPIRLPGAEEGSQ